MRFRSIGPQPPVYYPPMSTSPNPPNGTLTSGDLFGGFTDAGTDSGLNDPLSLLLPPGLGCDLTGCDLRGRLRVHHPPHPGYATKSVLAV
jgi:hypothetical protein